MRIRSLTVSCMHMRGSMGVSRHCAKHEKVVDPRGLWSIVCKSEHLMQCDLKNMGITAAIFVPQFIFRDKAEETS